jgi:hypothetical protein
VNALATCGRDPCEAEGLAGDIQTTEGWTRGTSNVDSQARGLILFVEAQALVSPENVLCLRSLEIVLLRWRKRPQSCELGQVCSP